MSSTFQPGLLRGKVALVTGGGSGINLAIAKRFAEHGAKLAIIGRSQEKLDAATKELTSLGTQALGFSADVRDYAAVANAIQQTRGQLGAIDIVVCGAAGNFPAPAEKLSANGFKAVVDIDLLGTFNTCRAAFEHLTKPGASIINISAPQAFVPMALQAHVCAAKAGVDMITRTLAIEWGAHGIRVNSIVPGATAETEGMSRLATSEAAADKIRQAIPLRRWGAKDELADLALFLCSPVANYINGAVIPCDGGLSLLGGAAWEITAPA
jgi:NAD(P)-dependent dehydrogenase (short-subunit alcohol dehydrogenase family)